ncbi:luciferin 4-monooxygenase-like [Watersipora subatra]|uniref:luciferin 4-monooxygenase-like n=1 Tax=Watersipora subatra TaxID=2589382 RepID=UPI00355BA99B
MAIGLELVIDLDSEKSLSVNTEGELYFHGPNIKKSEWRHEEATLDCLDGDWCRTGNAPKFSDLLRDIGYYDDEGFFHVVDRLKGLIKYKGFQVAPAELEALLLAHQKILDSAVVSVPCNEAGELPRAYIVAKPGQSASDEEINTYMKEKASNHKQLRGGIRVIDAIPKSASGKILRRVFKDQALKDI